MKKMIDQEKTLSKINNIKERYQKFIQNIELIDIRLVSANIENKGYSEPPKKCRIDLDTKAWYENLNKIIEAFHQFELTINSPFKDKTIYGKTSVTFCVTYKSMIPMTDEIFKIFEHNNLTINTWPYFREFVHNMHMRMNWGGLVAPLYKIGLDRKKKSGAKIKK